MSQFWEELSKKANQVGGKIGKATEGLGKQLERTADDIAKKTEDVVAIQKIKNEIRAKENENAHNCIDLGEIVYGMYEDGETLSTELVEICKELENRLDEIENLEDNLARLRGVVSCGSCESDMEYGSLFCNQCGEEINFAGVEEEMEFEVEYTYNDTKNKLYKLTPSTKDYIWGGDTLKTKYGKQSDSDVLAESWELSCHPDGPSILESEGLSLAEYIEANPGVLGSACDKFGEFPMLVKFIDAKNALSIQVHPDDAYSKANEGQLGKTEMWYVVDAKPDAFLYYGFKEEVSKEVFEAAIADDTLCDLLNKVEVKAGDMFFIEAGTIHAIGAGIVIAEIQQSSNVTYRVYDYGRLGVDGQPRELHVQKACDVTACVPPKTDYDFGSHLGHCEYFTVDKYELDGEQVINVDGSSFASFLCLDGQGTIECVGNTVVMNAGDSIFAPADTGVCKMKGKGTILVTYISE